MIFDVFIRRQRLAMMVSIVVTLAGLIATQAIQRSRRRRSKSVRPIRAPTPTPSRRASRSHWRTPSMA
jgi:hypothetical protein